MRNESTRPGERRLVGLFVVVLALGGLVAGCMHYGGVDGVVERARTKVAEYRPHPGLVPTPFDEAFAAPLGLPSAGGAGAAALPLPPLTPGTEGTGGLSATVADPLPEATTQPTSLPTATQTDVPSTATATASPVPTATSTPAYALAKPSVALSNTVHYWQTWNNCGPATLAMDLSYFGSKLDQTAIAATLRPDKDDKNTRPDEMADFALSQGLRALTRVNGDATRLKLLLSNGIPVIVETWMEPKPNDGMGHYRLLVGYDDSTQEWIAYDSYDARGVDPNKPYTGIRLPYDELASMWHVYDNTYIVIYTDHEAPIVTGILGADMNDQAMWERAMAATENGLQSRQQDAFGWFNLGSELVALKRPSEAAQAFDEARRIGLPWRMLWYQFGPFQAYYETARFSEVNALADATLSTAGNIEELFYWKGMALKGEGDTAGARQAWERAVQLNKNFRAPAEALAALPKGG